MILIGIKESSLSTQCVCSPTYDIPSKHLPIGHDGNCFCRQWKASDNDLLRRARSLGPGIFHALDSLLLHPAVCPCSTAMIQRQLLRPYYNPELVLPIFAFGFRKQRQRNRPLTHDSKTSNKQPHEILSGFTVAEFPPKGLDVWAPLPVRSVGVVEAVQWHVKDASYDGSVSW